LAERRGRFTYPLEMVRCGVCALRHAERRRRRRLSQTRQLDARCQGSRRIGSRRGRSAPPWLPFTRIRYSSALPLKSSGTRKSRRPPR